MLDVLIITDSTESSSPASVASSPAVEMKRAILADLQTAIPESSLSNEGTLQQVKILSTTEIESLSEELSPGHEPVLCPLTFNLPDGWRGPGRDVFAVCRDVETMRQTIAGWQFPVGNGHHWLPLVLTAKGILFAEAITQGQGSNPTFRQPLHLNDAQRQPLYKLGQDLTRSLSAPPGVYLMQFGMTEQESWFDRLIPFPDTPALASVGVQTPDLFLCHWYCLTHQPIRELSITAYAT